MCKCCAYSLLHCLMWPNVLIKLWSKIWLTINTLLQKTSYLNFRCLIPSAVQDQYKRWLIWLILTDTRQFSIQLVFMYWDFICNSIAMTTIQYITTELRVCAEVWTRAQCRKIVPMQLINISSQSSILQVYFPTISWCRPLYGNLFYIKEQRDLRLPWGNSANFRSLFWTREGWLQAELSLITVTPI